MSFERTVRDIARDKASLELSTFIIKLYESYPDLNIVDITRILSTKLNNELAMLHKHYEVIGKEEKK